MNFPPYENIRAVEILADIIGLGVPLNQTGVDKIVDDSNKLVPSPIYNLNSRFVGKIFESLPSGLYIQNGKKYMKR